MKERIRYLFEESLWFVIFSGATAIISLMLGIDYAVSGVIFLLILIIVIGVRAGITSAPKKM